VSDPLLTTTVAVIVPVFNRRNLLQETVSSLCAQTLASSEFIFVDDRSEDDTWTYLQSLPAIDARFKVMQKPADRPRGCQESRNIGLNACTASSVMFLDSDDVISPTCLEERAGLLARDVTTDIVVGRQAQFSERPLEVKWVNVPRPDIPDIDRFLNLAYPLDVPWVNGGVLIRTARLRQLGIRWRNEFDWDDVAFHFECLAAGLSVRWSSLDSAPDFYYRNHDAERYGQALFAPEGILGSTRMMAWMRELLQASGQLTKARRDALATSFFHACALRSIDAGNDGLADRVIQEAESLSLVSPDEADKLMMFRRGRTVTRRSRRLTYYWNRLNSSFLLARFYPKLSDGTYATKVPDVQGVREALTAILLQ
jgi:hypothetical protein